MKRVFLLLGLVLLLWCGKAQAISCTQSHVFVTGETLTAAVLNSNPANFVTCFQNIDNTNVGALGFYASQIIPTTVGQATFGGSQAYTFSNGLNINGTLTLNGTAFTLPLPVSSGGTNLTSLVGSRCIRSVSTTAFAEAGGDCITTAGGQTINGALTTTGLLTGVGVTAGTGTVKGASDGTTNTYIGPTYAASGAVASTYHQQSFLVQGGVGGVTVGTSSGGGCSGVSCYHVTGLPTLSPGFSSATSYSCHASDLDSQTGEWGSSSQTATTFQINIILPSGPTVGSSDHFYINCAGT